VFKHCADSFRLYLGGLTTIQGLGLFSPNRKCCIEQIYMDSNPQVPANSDRVQTVAAAIDFLTGLPPAGPFHFQCSIEPGTTLSTHDDCECHIRAADADEIWRVVDAVQPATHAATLRAKLEANPTAYLVCEPDGSIAVYANFDAFRASNGGLA
jgi:hypothetical protein